MALRLSHQGDTERFGSNWSDRFLGLYLLMQVALVVPVTSLTDALRTAFYLYLDVFLPYYVASRILKDIAQYRDVLMSFVVACLAMVPIAGFEYAKHWLLYSALTSSLQLTWGFSSYLGRGDLLRAVASSGQSIALGYYMMIGLLFWIYVSKGVAGSFVKRIVFAALVAGSIFALSRGPWLATVAGFVVYSMLGDDRGKFVRYGFLAIGACVGLATFTPYGSRLIEYLPFVGSVDAYNVTYRQQLIDVSMIVIKQNLWLGSFDFWTNPLMRQMSQGSSGPGESGIDLVNSYLGIALTYGVVGLGLFGAIFAAALLRIFASTKSAALFSNERALGAVLVATVVGIAVAIGTVSSIVAIPNTYWIVAGICVAYPRLRSSAAKDSVPALVHPYHANARVQSRFG